jgi:hypothetical protein
MMLTLNELSAAVNATDLNDDELRARLSDAFKEAGRDAEATLLLGPGGVAWREDKIVRAFRGRFHGVPTFLLARLREARQGGENSDSEAALTFARALGGLLPDELEPDQWQVELDWLEELVDADKPDADAVLGWFDFHFARLMRLVPARRRQQFAEGILQAHEDGQLNLSAW